jgi:hypothetical protein
MPLRRSLVHALDVIAYSPQSIRIALHVSSGTYVRAIAEALGGHCTSLRRTSVGPFSVDEAGADPGTVVLIGVAAALGRLPDEAVSRVPAQVRAGVLALDGAEGGDS